MIKTDFLSLAAELGTTFAARAADHDANDTFVADNFADLKEHGFFAAHVPAELGGGGATYEEIGAVLRQLGRSCGSTALSFSMHTHIIAAATWRWNRGDTGGEGMLRRVAAENLVLTGSGGSDWLDSSGTLEPAEGGYRMSGRKAFSSGSPAGDLFVTSGVLEQPEGPVVLHFAIPMRGEGVSLLDNWHTLGMRGTGSHDIVLENVFVPEAAVVARRPKGTFGPLNLVALVALPLVYGVYLGIAEAARDLALGAAARRRDVAETQVNVGAMENELCIAEMAYAGLMALPATEKPGPAATNEILKRRTICGNAAISTVEKAMDVIGGASFYRTAGIERLFRDVQGARYHPMPLTRQLGFTGRLALGLPIE